jgi:DNA-binding XRE family transcriptional regulator
MVSKWLMARRFSPERLRLARERAGFTQKSAAKAVGVSYQTYQNWEYGKLAPRINELLKVAELFASRLENFLENT